MTFTLVEESDVNIMEGRERIRELNWGSYLSLIFGIGRSDLRPLEKNIIVLLFIATVRLHTISSST